MIKPLIFASLYATVGFSGWGAYTAINEKDTSLSTITSVAKETNEKFSRSLKESTLPVYRFKDESGNWVYSNKPLDPSIAFSYDKEMQLLKSLPQEVMPTEAFQTNPKVTVGALDTDAPESKISNIMAEVKKVTKMFENRASLLNAAAKKETD